MYSQIHSIFTSQIYYVKANDQNPPVNYIPAFVRDVKSSCVCVGRQEEGGVFGLRGKKGHFPPQKVV